MFPILFCLLFWLHTQGIFQNQNTIVLMHEIKLVYLPHTREFYKSYFNYCFNHYTCYLKKTCQYPVFEIFLKAILDRYTSSPQTLSQTSRFRTTKDLNEKLQTSVTLSVASLSNSRTQAQSPVLGSCCCSVYQFF